MDIYLRLHRAVRLFQEKNRFVLDAYETGLPLLVSRIITDIASQEEVTASELASSLSLSPTSISRALSDLKTKRIVSVRSDPSDRRRQILRLTPKGIEALTEMDEQAERQLQGFDSHLARGEREMLAYYMRVFADGLSASPILYQRQEHPLRQLIRRITQALGLLENRVRGAGDLLSVEWHVLEKVAEQPGSVLAKTLAVCFHLKANTVAGIIQRLTERKLLVRVKDTRDRRQARLQLTSKGESLLAEVALRATERYRVALSSLSISQVESFVSLVSQFIGVVEVSLLSPDGEVLHCKQLVSEFDRAEAREFCALHSIRLARGKKLSERFFAQESFCFALASTNEFFATIEIQPSAVTDGGWSITHCVQHPSMDGLPLLRLFLEMALSRFRAYKPDAKVRQAGLVWS